MLDCEIESRQLEAYPVLRLEIFLYLFTQQQSVPGKVYDDQNSGGGVWNLSHVCRALETVSHLTFHCFYSNRGCHLR